MLRHASVTPQTSSTWMCCLRSPASRIKSACASTRWNASATRSRSAEPAWMSPAAATRIVFPMLALYPRNGTSIPGYPRNPMADDPTFEKLLIAMKNAAAALRDNDIDVALTGGFAVYARGGPPTEHDVDFMVRAEDVDRAIEVLTEAGFRAERPPEGWLYKVFDENDSMIDLIF